MTYTKTVFYKYVLCLYAISLLSCNSDNNPQETPINDTPVDSPTTGDTPDEDRFTGELDWVKTFGGTNEDNALSVVKSSDGGYAIAGYTQSTDGDIKDKTATDSDFWLLKVSPDGNLDWNKTYGGSGDDRAEKIIQTSDGGYAMVGYSRSNDKDVALNAGLQDYWIIKVNATGDIMWEKSFGFAGIDRAYSIIQTHDDGYFITGFLDVTASEGAGNDDAKKRTKSTTKHGVGEFWGIKLNANGDKEWRRFFGGSNNDRSYDVIQTADHNFIMIGSSESVDFDISNSKGSYDFWVVKVDQNGTKIWEKSFGGDEIDVAYAITATEDGKYIVIGDSRSYNGNVTTPKGNADLWMIQIDDNGQLIWEKSIGGSEFDTGRAIHKMNDGRFIITGNSRSNDVDMSKNLGQSDLLTLIINQNGELQWSTTTGGTNAEFGQGCIETTDHKIIVVGSSESNDIDISKNMGSKDVLVVKYK